MLIRKKINSMPLLILCILMGLLTGCSNSPPKDQSNICNIFREYPSWYKSASNSQKKWGTPIHVSMAIIKQESSFRHDAKPPRTYYLGFIPGSRPSTAYGYAQALDGTWDNYQRSQGRASRSNFDDSIMFVGWYTNDTHKALGISKWDAYDQYLVYHEGVGGYKRRSHRSKPFLLSAANKVKTNAGRYASQLKQCRAELDRKRNSWW